MRDAINIGLIGVGTVGSGVIKILNERSSEIERKLGRKITLKRVADRSLGNPQEHGIDASAFTHQAEDVVADEEIDILVETIGGYEPARTLVLGALDRGIQVVTANKALLALHGPEVFGKTLEKGGGLYFEASVASGIPIIKSLRESLGGDRVSSILGIVNGTSNFILTEMTDRKKDFAETLALAQEKGYAEADPSFDVEGIDSAHKIAILASLAFGVQVSLEEIHTQGITHITPTDVQYAGEMGYVIKLLAVAKEIDGELEVRVNPTMIPQDNLLAAVDDTYNAINIVGDRAGSLMFYGRGAGQMPAASAVVADIMDASRNLNLGVKPHNLVYPRTSQGGRVRGIEEIESGYYIRFSVIDKPGVLATISGIFGEHSISIASVIQKERRKEATVPLLIITHNANEGNMRRAINEIDQLGVVTDKGILIRVEREEE